MWHISLYCGGRVEHINLHPEGKVKLQDHIDTEEIDLFRPIV